MTVTINQKELIEMIQEKINSNVKVDEIIIQLELNEHSSDNIYIKDNSWFAGTFLKKQIKGEQ